MKLKPREYVCEPGCPIPGFTERTGCPVPEAFPAIFERYLEFMDDGRDDWEEEFFKEFNSGWRRCDGGTNMSQEFYDEFLKESKELSDDVAKEVINEFLGFEKSRIGIIREVSEFEKHENYWNVTRRIAHSRVPLFQDPSRNYIRFNVSSEELGIPWEWEMIDGRLFLYNKEALMEC